MTDNTGVRNIADRLGPVQAGLRSDLEITRHLFRGQAQYVVRDPLTFQTHQFSQYDYQILIALNDTATLSEVFDALVEQGTLQPDQADDFYQFILRLHQLNYLILPIADGKLLYQRFASRQRTARWRQVGSLLFLRIPLFNPDAFLQRTADFARPLFTRTAFAVWIVLMLAGLAILCQQWEAFKHPTHSILANDTLLFLWVALIGLKAFHEFGHAYACKIFGGDVPEMGAFLIAFTPCAYVDASAAWGFSKTRHRVIVSLAGMYFESMIALVALVVWSWTDDPLLSSCAHHIVVLSSAVTIGFNINPLMRYDGYYVLSDITGIPNLRQRSYEQVQSVLKRVLLGIKTPSAHESLRVKVLLFVYGVASVAYKITLVLAICAMIAMKFYLVGLGLAAMLLLSIVGGGMRKMLVYLWRSQETRPVRMRAVALSLVLLVLVPTAVATIPVPGSVVIPGIVQTRDDKAVYAQADGFLMTTAVPSGTGVERGQELCLLENDAMQCRVEEARAETDTLRLQYLQGVASDPHVAAAAKLRLIHAEEKLAQVEREYDCLRIAAPIAGVLVRMINHRDTGRFVRKGEVIASLASGPWIVRCLATAEQVADVRPSVGQSVRVRVMAGGVHEVRGTVEEVAVKGSHRVFSAALTHLAGGKITVAPGSLEAPRPLFEVAVRLHDVDHLPLRHDVRAMVAFDTVAQTYGAYALRRYRQFLNRLRVQ